MSSTAEALLAPLVQRMRDGHGKLNEDRVKRSLALAEEIYGTTPHWTGVSLLEHALGTAEILMLLKPDEDTFIACLLQHALTTRAITLEEIGEKFGAGVRSMVASIHLLSHVTMGSRRSSIEDVRLMLLGVSEDVRVLLVLLCERCFVLEHLGDVSPFERRRVCRDALDVFAPVAARLGIQTIKQRLEGLAFPVVYANDAGSIVERLAQTHEKYGDFLPTAAQLLETALKAQGIACVVDGREKHLYSIFSKMRTKSISDMEQLYDLFALRVIVDSVEDCYRALGFLHQMGRPVTNRFKDYIGFAKPNGYQSLHTSLARLPGIPDGLYVEVQLRTHSMHREAEYGIAAHWSYKEGGSAGYAMRRVQLQQMLTTQQAVGNDAKARLADHIFVLTPRGDIVELPEGATPLDFAFQIHTDLGISFKSARVNGRIVPLDYELENGDSVEVIVNFAPHPSPEWMKLLKMASSRSRLKRYFFTANRLEYINRGRELLNQELKKKHAAPLTTDLALLRRYDGGDLSIEQREDVLVKAGQGAESAASILTHIDGLVLLSQPKKIRLQRKDAIVEIEGGMRVPLRFAKCCKPQVKKGNIIGGINRIGEVIIHTDGCKMLKKANPGRRVVVRWK